MQRYALNLFAIFIIFSSAFATDGAIIRSDSVTKVDRHFRVIPVPAVGYSPDTHWMGGVYVGFIAYLADTTRPSSSSLSGTYSERKQFRVYADPSLYVKSYNLTATLEILKWPASYWGIGNQTRNSQEERYTADGFSLETVLSKEIQPKFYLGAGFTYEHFRIPKVEPGRQLDTAQVPGREPSTTTGPELTALYDTRDNIFAPRHGERLSLVFTTCGRSFGSDYTYQQCVVDVRKYIPTFAHQVIALQSYDSFINGNPGFRNLSTIGNEWRFRGYPEGRFRDKQLISAQVEYRAPIWWRFGAAAFVGMGDVSRNLSAFTLKDLKPTSGFGLRILVLSKERITVRLDQAYGRDMTAFYFAITEAF